MGKNVIVNGQEYPDKSVVQLFDSTGAPVLFQLMGEATGGAVEGIVEMACGEFSVDTLTGEYTILHGMNVAPDVICVIPKYFHDTQDNNFAILAASRWASATGGRRTVDPAATHFQGGIAAEEKDWSTEITLSTSSLAKFRFTYMDAEGNTGTQVYRWVAVKFKEDADA